MKTKSLLLLSFLCCLAIFVSAQDEKQSIPRVIGPSPNAAAIAKYGEVPVSHYTGTADISIPIFEIKSKDLSVPIQLSYHSGGIKVQEEASLVGLGWTIFTGGVISRVVRGADDLETNGYVNSYMPASVGSNYMYVRPDNTTYNRDILFLSDALNGLADGEPDIFQFNINGASGKFVLNKRTNINAPITVTLLSQADVKIEVVLNQTTRMYEWIITNPAGIKYYFNTTEINTARTGVSTEELQSDLWAKDATPKETVTSWFLDKIQSPNGPTINFSYTKTFPGAAQVLNRSQIKRHIVSTNLAPLPGNVSYCPIGPYHEFTYFSSYSEIQEVYLKTITFPDGKIEFSHSKRDDIEPVVNTAASFPLKLDNISIYSKEDGAYVFQRKFDLSYSYFDGTDYLTKRLKLLSVTETNGLKPRAPYVFTYNTLLLPAKDSKAIDHWGFYNGARNDDLRENTNNGDHMAKGTLVPPITIKRFGTNEDVDFVGADRDPNPLYSQAAILQKITYPTGGSTSFEYEQNNYYSPETIIKRYQNIVPLHKKGPESSVIELQPNEALIKLDSIRVVEVESHWACMDNTCMTVDNGDIEFDAADLYIMNGSNQVFTGGVGININYYNQQSADGFGSFTLDPGTYKIKALCDGRFFNWLTVKYITKDTTIIKERYGPGVRVKSLTNYDGINHANDQKTSYSYLSKFPGETNLYSSGVLMTTPQYNYLGTVENFCTASPEAPVYYEVMSSGTAVFRESSSIMPISSSAQGGPLGYSIVTESQSQGGKTVYEYFNSPDDINLPSFPNVPTIGNPQNGSLKNQYIYSTQPNGQSKLVKRISRSYNTDNSRGKTIRGVKIPELKFAIFRLSANLSTYTYSNVKFYDLYSNFTYLSTDTVVDYSTANTTDSLVNVTKYEYNHPQYLQLSRKSYANSKKQTITANYKYPFDYPNDPVYQSMVSKYMIGINIESIEDVNGNPNKSIRNNFSIWPGSKPLISSTEEKYGTGSYEKILNFSNYDSEGNILALSKNNDVPTSYKWGYDNNYPVVEIVNANSNQFYYESFEYGANKGILQAFARTGKMVKASGFQVNFTIPDQKQYILTYWYRVGTTGTWIRKSINYTGPSYVINDGNYIDEVRIYPKDALMRTYTYDPLLGISSTTSESDKTIYFLYDGYGQLKESRDQDNKVLKIYDYQYQKPITQ